LYTYTLISSEYSGLSALQTVSLELLVSVLIAMINTAAVGLLNRLLLKFNFVLPYLSNNNQTPYRARERKRVKGCGAWRNEQLQQLL
jgi:hypothetical protein